MTEVGIRALQQNASSVVAEVVGGETVTITDRGHPVARLTPIPSSALQGMLESGRARPPRRDLTELPSPEGGPSLSTELAEMRNAERY